MDHTRDTDLLHQLAAQAINLPTRRWSTRRVLTIYSAALSGAIGILAALAIDATLPGLPAILFLILFTMPLLLPGKDSENKDEANDRSGPAIRNGKNTDKEATNYRGGDETFPGTTLIRP